MTECVDHANNKGGDQRVLHKEPAFPSCSSHTSWHATVVSRKTWSINCSTRARNAWRGRCLLLANFGKEGEPEPVLAKISQETLAEIIGTTRPRVSHFMNKFRRLGLIDYNGQIEVHRSLLNVVLHEKPEIKS